MKYLILALLSAILFGIIYINNDYMSERIRTCEVLDKMPSEGRSSSYYYLILKEEKGIVFDITVSPATYSQTKIGDFISFTLRDFDIKETPKQNVIYFFGPIITLALTLLFLLSWFLNKHL